MNGITIPENLRPYLENDASGFWLRKVEGAHGEVTRFFGQLITDSCEETRMIGVPGFFTRSAILSREGIILGWRRIEVHKTVVKGRIDGNSNYWNEFYDAERLGQGN